MEYNINIGEAVARYLIMMAIIIIAGFSGQWVFALLGLPIFLTAIIGWCPIKTFLNQTKHKGTVKTSTKH